MGNEIYRVAPPLPDRVVSTSGETIYTLDDLETGRQVWQSIGGMQVGSIWGHGALIAPDWSADWLHREAEGLLTLWSQQTYAMDYAVLPLAQQLALQARLQEELKPNRYDAASKTLTISDDRATVIRGLITHYDSRFTEDPATAALRQT